MDFDHSYADYLDEEGINAIQKLEEETGKQIMAYYAPPSPANLSDDQLTKIRELENRLCVRLVVYDSH